MSSLSELVAKIQQKKELRGIAPPLVEQTLSNYIKKIPLSPKNLPIQEEKVLIKEIRAKLRKMTGQFQKSSKKREILLEQDNIQALLKTHQSTAERLLFYPYLKNLIKNLSVHKIIDLGCGLNPIALANKTQEYYAYDIKEDELSLVKKFFMKHKIKGYAKFMDIRALHDNELPKADLCLLFKVLDLIEHRGHKLAEIILKQIPCPYILISFSTKTLSGKPMNHPQRGWLEQLSHRLGYSFHLIKSQNEIFYLIKKEF